MKPMKLRVHLEKKALPGILSALRAVTASNVVDRKDKDALLELMDAVWDGGYHEQRLSLHRWVSIRKARPER